MTIYEALSTAGLSNLDPHWQGDKQRAGKNLCEWFYGHEKMLSGGKLIRWASFGNMAISDETMVWRSWEQDGQKITKKESTEIENEMLARADQKAKDKKDANEITRQKCAQDFANLSSGNIEIYLRRKSISFPFGGKISLAATPLRSSKEPHLAIPLYDTDHQLWNLQHIYHEGDKTFEKGGKKSGLFYLLETPHHTWFSANPETIYIAEGFATAASIQEALGDAAYCVSAFDAGNLLPVSKALRSALPHTKIILCADNDTFTKKPGGSHWNPGLENARKAAQACGGAVVFPDFGPQTNTKFTDFNDLHCFRGLQIVKEQILNCKAPETPKDIQPINLRRNNEKIIPPTEIEVIRHLKAFYGESLCQQNKCYFHFKETHWTELDDDDFVKIKQQIYFIASYTIHGWQVDQFFNTFLDELPINTGPSFFEPTRLKTNFLNGALELVKLPNATYKLQFHQNHRATDNMTSVIPFNLPPMSVLEEGAKLLPAPRFEKLLQDIYDPMADDFEVRRRLVLQLMGAALIPEFAKIVFFTGPPGTGKSTILLLIVGLVGSKNCSKILPSKLSGSNLATLVGKLINFHTDIDINSNIKDDILKCLIDGEATSVERKYKKNIDAVIPRYHLYAGNGLPKTLETGAYSRRVIIMKTDKWRVPSDHIHHYEDLILHEEREALLQRSLIGLNDLVNSGGHYAQLQDSINQVNEMQKENDFVQQFLDEVKSGEFEMRNFDDSETASVGPGPNFFGRGKRIILGEDIPKNRVSSRVVWSEFSRWFSAIHAEGSGNRRGFLKKQFKTALASKGFLYGESDSLCYYKGFIAAE